MEIHLLWTQVSLAALNELDSHFYAFGGFGRVYYIGKAYRMAAGPEIRQNLRSFEMDPRGLQFWLGQLVDTGAFERVSAHLVRDIENLLIFRYQPPYNTHYKESYYGRTPFTIHSMGSHPFPVETIGVR